MRSGGTGELLVSDCLLARRTAYLTYTAAQDFPKARERLEDLKRSGRNAPRPRERITRSKIGGKQQEGECTVM
jgi:hypothetical protein